MKFEIFKNEDGEYRWRLLSAKGEIMSVSGAYDRRMTAYASLTSLINAITSDKYELKDVTGDPPNNIDFGKHDARHHP